MSQGSPNVGPPVQPESPARGTDGHPSLPGGAKLSHPVRRLTAFQGKERGGLGTHREGLAHMGASEEQTWQG